MMMMIILKLHFLLRGVRIKNFNLWQCSKGMRSRNIVVGMGTLSGDFPALCFTNHYDYHGIRKLSKLSVSTTDEEDYIFCGQCDWTNSKFQITRFVDFLVFTCTSLLLLFPTLFMSEFSYLIGSLSRALIQFLLIRFITCIVLFPR